MLRLERLTVADATAGPELRPAQGPELLYVESGPVIIGDDFGLEGQFVDGAELLLEPPTSYSLRTDGAEPATILRFSVGPAGAQVASSTSPANVTSEVLFESELPSLPAAPLALTVLRAAWEPGTDAGRRSFAGPLALLVEDGILSVTSPSGLEGQLSAGDTFVIPAGLPLRQRNAGDDTADLLIVEVLPEGAPVYGSSEAVTEVTQPSITPAPSAAPDQGTEADATAGGTSVLFVAEAKSDGFSQWPLSGSWKVVHDLLVNDGSSESADVLLTPFAPGESGVNDYAIEATVRWIRDGVGYGVAARMSDTDAYFAGVTTPSCVDTVLFLSRGLEWDWNGYCYEVEGALDSSVVKWDQAWHTMRMEVSGTSVRLLVDDRPALKAEDARVSDGGATALWSYRNQVSVSCFAVMGLDTSGVCSRPSKK
jgi:quercetin dioxygenase-like cupin family protein